MDQAPSERLKWEGPLSWGIVITAGILLAIFIRYSSEAIFLDLDRYLPIHLGLEMAGMLVLFVAFTMGWATYKRVQSLSMMIFCLVSLFVGCIDFAHTLSFDGMPSFLGESSTNTSAYFWLVGRISFSLGLVAMAIFSGMRRQMEKERFWGLTLTLAAVLLFYLRVWFYPERLPVLFVEGQGLTPIKIMVEWVAITLSTFAGILFLSKAHDARARKNDDVSLRAMSCASFLFAMSGVFFTFFHQAESFMNFLGHVYKVAASLFLYRAIFNECVLKPYREMRGLAFEASAANQTKSRFLANVSHELRTPLGVITGFTGVIQGSREWDDETRDMLERVSRNADQLRLLVDDLLDLAKIESDQIMVAHHSFSPVEVVMDVKDSIEVLARKSGTTLDVEVLPSTPASLVSDPLRFRQILVNVIGNAVKFSPKGYVRVVLQGDRGRWLRVSVEDTGIGIAQEKVSSLFLPFSQADTSMMRSFGGTGLGLALSRQLARVLGGDLWLDKSEPGKGSLFVLTIADEKQKDATAKAESAYGSPQALPKDSPELSF